MLFENGYNVGSLMDLTTEIIGFIPNSQEEAWIYISELLIIVLSLYSAFKVILSIFNKN